MRNIVAIATTGRAEIAARTIQHLEKQVVRPDKVVVVIAEPDDLDTKKVSELTFPVEVLMAPKGLTSQRNMALSTLEKDDVLLFLDDDFLIAPNFLSEMIRVFECHANIAMVTGTVLADGIHGPGIDHKDAETILAENKDIPPDRTLATVYNCYGCNMALRGSHVVNHNLRFDTKLKFYGWLEDVDFSRQMSGHGRIVKSGALLGVHLGTKLTRSSGKRLGYSQISNPIYLLTKGTMRTDRAVTMMARNFLSNFVKAVRPEPEIDRLGRLTGNMIALGDLIRGKLSPERVAEFK